MTIRPNKSDPWHSPGSAFEPNQGPANDSDQFGQLDTRGMGLRGFIERETQTKAGSVGTNETLIPGKLYLRQQPSSGLWELTHNRGRNTFDCWVGESREEMLDLAESMGLVRWEE